MWGNFTSPLTKTIISVADYNLRVKLRGNSPFSKAISDSQVDGNEIRFGRFTNWLQLFHARKRKSVTKWTMKQKSSTFYRTWSKYQQLDKNNWGHFRWELVVIKLLHQQQPVNRLANRNRNANVTFYITWLQFPAGIVCHRVQITFGLLQVLCILT